MKKLLFCLLFILLTVVLVGCSKEVPDAIKFKKEYESQNGEKQQSSKIIRTVSIEKDNPFIYSTAEEIVDKMNNGETFVVYFGFSTCPWCRSVIEQLIECAKDNNIEKIYYVDVLNIRDTKVINENGEIETSNEGTKGYMELIEKLSNVLEEYTLNDEEGNEILTGEKRIYAPNVVAVVNGKAEKLETGISDDLKDPYSKLTAKMKKETYNKFKCIFKCLKEKEKLCTTKTC